MFEAVRLPCFVLAIFLGYSFGLELQSEESTLPKRLTAVLQHGKRLKLIVGNVNHPEHRWKFNGTHVSEKCEVVINGTGSTLTCSDMDWSDEGLYEHQGITRSGQSETLLAVYVKVVECEKAAKQEVEVIESASQKSRKCFCSGITDRCEMADDLFRSKIIVELLDSYMVPSNWSSDGNSLPLKYYSLPDQLKGNLLMSYGGFLDIPAMDQAVDDSPDIVLQGNDQTLVYNSNLQSTTSGELNRRRIQMTERDWRDLSGSYVSRDTFMAVLSRVKEFYIRSRGTNELKPLDVVLDSADYRDHGLGKVTTVEKCECHPGYDGLSCEKCSLNYYRRHAIGLQGVCVSLRETWNLAKQEYARKQRMESYRNSLRSF